jgi:hypothetical protein
MPKKNSGILLYKANIGFKILLHCFSQFFGVYSEKIFLERFYGIGILNT